MCALPSRRTGSLEFYFNWAFTGHFVSADAHSTAVDERFARSAGTILTIESDRCSSRSHEIFHSLARDRLGSLATDRHVN